MGRKYRDWRYWKSKQKKEVTHMSGGRRKYVCVLATLGDAGGAGGNRPSEGYPKTGPEAEKGLKVKTGTKRIKKVRPR